MTTQFLLGYILLAVLSGPVCLAVAQECKNGGTVLDDGDGDFFCDCPEPFYGTNCEHRKPDCQHGGKCLQCQCVDPYYGNDCQNKKPECKNGGKLVDDGKGGFQCQCVDPFYGNTCENSCTTEARLLRDSNGNLIGCYIFLTTADTWANWNGETTGCSKYGATLVVIDSAAEDDAIKKYVKTLSIPAECKYASLFTAGQRDVQGNCVVGEKKNNFYWKPVGRPQKAINQGSYTGWASGEPNCDARGSFQGDQRESCIVVYGNGSGWNDVSCAHVVACAICEQPLIGS